MPRKEFESFTRLDASDVNTFLMDQSVMTFADSAARGSAITTPVEGMVAYLEDSNTIQAYNSTAWVTVANAGTASFNFVQTLYFTSSGTFTKATYPWLRAIRVKCQGAGGGGGGSAATIASQLAVAAPGTGGVYAESFITDIAGLDASITVTRGAGGAGGAAGNNSGSDGGSSSFGSLVSANGGIGGPGAAPGNTQNFTSTKNGPTTGTGDLVIPGGSTSCGPQVRTDFVVSQTSGGSFLAGSTTLGNSISLTGANGKNFGGGATGAQNTASQSARAGGTGGNGIVIVELYA
jgi:hypothetical protein